MPLHKYNTVEKVKKRAGAVCRLRAAASAGGRDEALAQDHLKEEQVPTRAWVPPGGGRGGGAAAAERAESARRSSKCALHMRKLYMCCICSTVQLLRPVAVGDE